MSEMFLKVLMKKLERFNCWKSFIKHCFTWIYNSLIFYYFNYILWFSICLSISIHISFNNRRQVVSLKKVDYPRKSSSFVPQMLNHVFLLIIIHFFLFIWNTIFFILIAYILTIKNAFAGNEFYLFEQITNFLKNFEFLFINFIWCFLWHYLKQHFLCFDAILNDFLWVILESCSYYFNIQYSRFQISDYKNNSIHYFIKLLKKLIVILYALFL